MILIKLKRISFGDELGYSIVVSSKQISPNSNKFLEKIGNYKPIIDL